VDGRVAALSEGACFRHGRDFIRFTGASRTAEEVLIEYLRDKQLLLILDNCEHFDLRLRQAGCETVADVPTSASARDQSGSAQYPW